ncbi:polysaccharide biosynthesis protein [Varunaivibrio sulfuroxidans]|uniref:O-antigen biosynthesis protein WbqV n=1 Tax=Varunaivibrio sulfuroxidans TaxID=1773489 RepID=A0A4R3JH49_9PROT|nr:nucleoside-diphosphate sugar epimerase/dehydratase [Varunaivibrio sulfuroxidans]TCS64825.1 O-antigen biosynthesis protein WbqV [Varunaivibrio sulfuroxidans]WES29874.1 nucleoside-diphosphate sugar epimerase/dehydratase [Varunaivibrio sulfuroxidans]
MRLTPFHSPRSTVAFVHDTAMAAASFVLALLLRLGGDFGQIPTDILILDTTAFTTVCAGVFLSLRMYRGVWRYASLRDLILITKAVTLAILIFFLLTFIMTRLESVPRSLPFINWFVLMALLGGPRFLYRLIKDRRFEWTVHPTTASSIPVLLVGANDEAELFLRALGRDGGAPYRAVGIVAESSRRVGRDIQGVGVMGAIDDIAQVVATLRAQGESPQRLIVTHDKFSRTDMNALLETAESLGMSLARLPRLTDLKSGAADTLTLKPVDIADLLGRPQTPLDRAQMAELVRGKRVLITGAGGSIGSELVRQVSDFAPCEIVLLDSSEFALYTIDMALFKRHPEIARHAVIADVRDGARINRIFARLHPELVFHAAALKHVPLVETNIFEGARTNVAGTANIAEGCLAAGVDVMVIISTDKAVNPTNIMGATKRFAEAYCQALDRDRAKDAKTKFVTVRFGNVLGSTGSVVPLFQRQLAEGGPITVTHPDMTRYFMTIREAVELVLQASAIGVRDIPGEGRIFVLDMGAPVKIVDLARTMIRLAGLRPDEDIAITFTGPRPGEKLFEEVLHGTETLVATSCPGILLATPRVSDIDVLRKALDALNAAAIDEDEGGVMAVIKAIVPEYAPPAHHGRDKRTPGRSFSETPGPETPGLETPGLETSGPREREKEKTG